MTITIKCPGCGRSYELADTAAGKQAKCKCGKSIHVPVPGADDMGLDLAPLDDIDDPLAAPVSSGPMLQSVKGDAALRTALDPAGKVAERETKKKKRAEKERKSPLMLFLIIGGSILGVALVALIPIILVTIANRPGFSTLEDAHTGLKDAIAKGDWEAQFKAYSPQSRDALLTMMLRNALFNVQTSTEVREVLEQYGVSDDSDRNRLFEAEAELVDQRTKAIMSAVKRHEALYADLGLAIEAAEERKLFNALLQTMRRKDRKEIRRLFADSEMKRLEVSGDRATATLEAVIGDETYETPIAFARVGGRWYVDIPDGATASHLFGGAMAME